MPDLKTLIITFWCFVICVALLFTIETILEYTYLTEGIIQKSINSAVIQKNQQFLDNLRYLEHSSVCNGSDLLGVIIVTSYVGNVEARSAIRRSIPQSLLDTFSVKRVFLLAEIPAHDKTQITQRGIRNENERFNDLVQGNFIESYRNLTYKHLMGLKWAFDNCAANAKYVLKMDDDTVVNIYEIVKVLKDDLAGKRHFMAGYLLRNMEPKRDPANKWYVKYSEYGDSKYPPFLSGWFYITIPQVLPEILNLSKRIQHFWIDDAYITGILREHASIELVPLNHIFTIHSEYLDCCIQDMEDHRYKCEIYAGPNGGDWNLIIRFYHALEKCRQGNTCDRKRESGDSKCIVAGNKQVFLDDGKASIDQFKLF